MGKRALLVGCNYPGTKAELHGCVNDVKRMYRSLVEKFGFAEDEIVVLIDTDSEGTQPTGANIRKALANLIEGTEDGGILFFHYSGHGVRVPAESGEPDDTGYDECIVPCDMNLITDDDFRDLVDKLPEGCRITLVSDSCHSGGLIENAKEQVGDSSTGSRSYSGEEEEQGGRGGGFRDLVFQGVQSAFESRSGIKLPFKLGSRHRRQEDQEEEQVLEEETENGDVVKNKSLPLSVFIDLLKEKTGRQDVSVGNIRPTLFDVFGEDASPKVKKFVNLLFQRLQSSGGNDGGQGGIWGAIGGLAQDFLKTKLEESGEEYASPAVKTHANPHDAYAGSGNQGRRSDMAVLVSGCQSDETSADAKPGGNKEGAYGALSNAVQSVLRESDGRGIGNKDLVLAVRELLAKQGFKQHPGLYCNDEHADQPFICEFLAY
ncbi:hypothetical protein SELMODRAFT_270839 [Selaginella moellendorffii]|uniref:Peptidase C14 caspase domain-containing protein n=1 Tax=Selaginella moellendorffii TaxID=88036 RepID=D8RHQ9_SELML|nr:metacaspase-5 [Selaginella moellendorffii]XP_024531205.1 metacaspase-5 [Selaginella moellendorffii]EFJ04429.1 hypothetical protein SELMODRAFT_229801 [Selaginella moellendorffii]EFJ28570.1 hypothetical protein SELMODRAFT_270839 [Selaginella moellendorffii]|eukprot:XP_024523784.1 metacaspase-5 [Selaginella moellendorffii]